MFGAIIGDVIGSPFEQYNTKSLDFRLFDRGGSVPMTPCSPSRPPMR